jgi:hypothetical protein
MVFGAVVEATGLLAIFRGKPETAHRLPRLIGDVHSPSIGAQEFPVCRFQHLARHNERLPMGFVPVRELCALVVRQVVTVVNVEEVSSHRPMITVANHKSALTQAAPLKKPRLGGGEAGPM